MAVVQISQIKHRRGLSTDLPQLASAELGWSIDSQQLFIGNGTITEGAPSIGNTEIPTFTASSLARLGILLNAPVTTTATLADNTANSVVTGASIASTQMGGHINYTIVRNNNARTGQLTITRSNSAVYFDEEYSESANVGVTFNVYLTSNVSQVYYTTTSTGYSANVSFNITPL